MSELNEELLEDESDDVGEIGEVDEEALLQDDEDVLNLESEEMLVTESKSASDNEETGGSRIDKFASERQRITAPTPSQDVEKKVTTSFLRQNFRGKIRGRSGCRQQRFNSYQDGAPHKHSNHNNIWPPGRGKTVLINPRFQGTVPVRDNARLAWDSQQSPWQNVRPQGNMQFPMQGPPRMQFGPPMFQYPNPPMQGPQPMYMMPPQRLPVNHNLNVNHGPLMNPGNIGSPFQQPFFNVIQHSFVPEMPVSQVQGQQNEWYNSNPPLAGCVNNFQQPSNTQQIDNNQFNSYVTPMQQSYRSTMPDNNLPYNGNKQVFSRRKNVVGDMPGSITREIPKRHVNKNDTRLAHKRLGPTGQVKSRPPVMTEVTVTNVTTVQIEDSETRDLRLKIEEQKRKREQVLKWKEQRRLNQLKESVTTKNMTHQDSPPSRGNVRGIREGRGPTSNRLLQPRISVRTPVLKPIRQIVRNNLMRENHGVTVPTNSEEELLPSKPQPSSGFLANRKILMKDQSLLPTRTVRIRNIATSTGNKKIFQICKSIGDVQDNDEEEERETIFEQTYNEIKNEKDCYETYNPLAEDVENIWVCEDSIGTKDNELVTLGQRNEGECDTFWNCEVHWRYHD